MFADRYSPYLGLALMQPKSILVLNTVDTSPIETSNEPELLRNVKLYKKLGYPLGKSKKGLKKWLRRRRQK